MKQLSPFFAIIAALCACLLPAAAVTPAFGQTPPSELEGSWSAPDAAVELRWHVPDADPAPAHYNVYRKSGGDPDFLLLAEAGDRRYNDAAVVTGTGYSYRVTAVYAAGGESSPSNTVIVTAGSPGDSAAGDSSGVVRFISDPVLSATAGNPYQYQAVTATTPPGLAVCYELTHAPSGMSVDANGLITWLPGSLGVFEVELKARVCPDGEDAEQKFYLMVLSGAAASITGTVTDTAGSPLDSVRIKIFDVTTGVFVLKTRTDSAGEYAFPIVNPGTYFVRADADGTPFEDVWYVNSPALPGATPVVVGENSGVQVNFVLSGEHALTADIFSVSGTVRDSSGTPVAGAPVSLLRLSHDHHDSDDFYDDDSRGGHSSGDDSGEDDSERRAFTDSTGSFLISARGGDYLVRAKARGFFEQFWDGKASPLEANILGLHSDTSGIDFALLPKSPGLDGPGSISGTVRRADNLAPLRAEVLGFMKNSSGHFTGLVASDHTDSAGAYTLDELPAGFYVMMVKGEDGIVPTFYSGTGGTPFADSASLVPVGAAAVTGIDIDALVDSADGLNDISGEVESETPGKASFRSPSAVVPLAGAIVTVVDASGNVAGSGVSGPDGSYTAPGLAPGNYTVVFQKPGALTSAVSGSVAYQEGMPASITVNGSLAPSAAPGGIMLSGVSSGWNLVSVPVAVPDYTPGALFPTASSSAYGYAGSYQAAAVTENGRGYWIKFPAAQVVSFGGSAIGGSSATLAAGWNLIGPLSAPVSAGAIVTVPSGVIVAGPYGYDGGYHTASVLQPGKGYWVKSSAAGSIEFTGEAGAGTAAGAAPGSNEDRSGDALAAGIEFSDELGNTQILMVTAGTAGGPSPELPPVPPAGAFDVRFVSGERAVAIGNDPSARTFAIHLQAAGARTTVTLPPAGDAGTAGIELRLLDAGGNTIAVSSEAPVAADLGDARELTLTVTTGGRPHEYRLEQNYPNPFNPSTAITWQIPADSRVVVRVYNALGQLSGTLADGIMPAGVHTANWDAGSRASGVYFVRIEATSVADPGTGFTKTMKMLLVR